ncbi:hypothetical protein HBI56_019240 [Parastagonospora nodorum]|uniref:Uncharacterized protein n=1 Tax=Phaeosphaeria nodorum (strain SN15 / ATCC MYA-4574 / FGSC 10173) TaxID=321614 RepID=A0A7U2F2P5_PHANO|nr:hypothetical protein HBH56_080730 [Parastagonospora nodorum]QRC96528.1 hypothetical protein JI435_409190 [Parastagonospora nodorum SN15]KAH3929867.1 hypothetical protein HBH54_121090 [Parastagonospora nodorum]KAH3955322.1 hypothetical protein HBH53_003550 [Parastagonospora nodorum]KAH3976809.1 hypothetical protein HBH51_078040 [Parastagonospora nodorum]
MSGQGRWCTLSRGRRPEVPTVENALQFEVECCLSDLLTEQVVVNARDSCAARRSNNTEVKDLVSRLLTS